MAKVVHSEVFVENKKKKWYTFGVLAPVIALEEIHVLD